MLTPSLEVLPWLAAFASAMTAPSFQNLLVLFGGAVLAPGARLVTTSLRALGRPTGNFSRYHSFFNRARWCPLLLSRLLLALLVRTFLAPNAPLIVIVDEHLERRRARQLPYRGVYRDPVRSNAGRVVLAWGIRWLVFALLVPVPWSPRGWALPFLVVPLLNEKLCQRLQRQHHTSVEVAGLCLGHLRRWQPHRPVLFLGDGTFATVPLANRCRRLPAVQFVSRLRWDAVLHAFPEPPPPGKRGRKPTKGPRLPKLSEVRDDPKTPWRQVTLRWYGGQLRCVEITTGTCLWYRGGQPPVPLRWVIVRSPAADPQPLEPTACFCTDAAATPEQIVEGFVLRWNIEVTFAEIRAHLGFETQRYWSQRATNRVTPCLFGLFSLVVVAAQQLHPERLPLRQSSWYPKDEATFADALAAVRRYLWQALTPALPRALRREFVTCAAQVDVSLIPGAVWRQLQEVACYAS
jgi:hypothetical protein